MAEYVEDINFENPNLYWEFGDEKELDDEFEDMVAEGHLVAVRWSMSGTHNGSGLMSIPATGQDFWGDIISFYRIADGKIVEGWMVVDALAMMEQLGIMPGE